MRKIVIIGCNAAGMTSASYSRKTDRTAEITVVERGKYPAYSRCGLPYVIEGVIPNFEDLLISPVEWYRMNKINLMLETTATEIDTSEKTVKIAHKEGEERTLDYDSLVLCTGAEPVTIPVPGKDLPQVYQLRTLEDGRRVFEKAKECKSVAVIGARFVGIETAAALSHRGCEVTVVEMLPQILDGILDPEFASEVQKSMEERGVKFLLNSALEEIKGDGHVEAVVAGGHEFSCEMVVTAVGVRANIELAERAGIEVSKRPSAIKVNEKMETDVDGVYAAGDCVICPTHAVVSQPWMSQLGTVAVRQAKIAGINAAGGNTKFPAVLGACASKVFDVEIASTGLTETYARRFNLDCISAGAKLPARPHYLPEKVPLRVKLVARRDGRLIGGQLVGIKEAGLRAEIISAAIAKEMTVDELSMLDNCYCPVIADVNEPLSAAAELLLRKLR
jgi:NADH oxidase (H2O2-forming)